MKRLLSFIILLSLVGFVCTEAAAQCPTGQTEITISITTDDYGWEIYWELEENGTVVASGGNPQVEAGKQQWTVDPMIPGQYGNNQTYTESVCVNSNSTIDFTIIDDWGDGLYDDAGYTINIGGCDWNVVGAHTYTTETVTNTLPLPDNNIVIEALDFDGEIGEKSCLTGTILNKGTNSLTSFDMTWQVNNGATITRTFDNINVPCGETFAFSSDQPIEQAVGTTIPIAVSFDNPNGAADEIPGDNSQNVTATVNRGRFFNKQVLLEEFSGAWCGYCPDGALILEEIIAENPNRVVGVTLHNGDAMEFPDGDAIVSAFQDGFPSGAVDRVLWPGEPAVGISRGQWAGAVEQRPEKAPMCVSFTATFEAATRVLTVNVDAQIVDDVEAGDYRVSVYVLEDKVTGSGSGYDQVNYYNNVMDHPYYQTGNPIVGFEHNKTLRAVLNASTDVWGDNGVISSTDLGNYTKTYTYTVPASYNENEMYVVAFITRYVSQNDQQVINAIKGGHNFASASCNEIVVDCPKTFFPTSIEEVAEASTIDVYPNPVQDRVNVKVAFKQPTEVTIDLFNSMGQRIVTSGVMASNAGVNTYFVDTRQLSNGIYHLILRTDSKEILSKEIVVAR